METLIEKANEYRNVIENLSRFDNSTTLHLARLADEARNELLAEIKRRRDRLGR